MTFFLLIIGWNAPPAVPVYTEFGRLSPAAPLPMGPIFMVHNCLNGPDPTRGCTVRQLVELLIFN